MKQYNLLFYLRNHLRPWPEIGAEGGSKIKAFIFLVNGEWFMLNHIMYHIPHQYLQDVKKGQQRCNMPRLFCLAVFTMVWEIMMIAVSILGEGYYPQNLHLLYVAGYVFYALFNLVTALLCNIYRKKPALTEKQLKVCSFIVGLYLIVSLLWSLFIVTLDQQMYKQVISYIIPLVIITNVLIIRPLLFFTANICALCLLLAMLFLTENSTAIFLGHIANLVILIFFILFGNVTLYRTFCENEVSKLKIQKLSYVDYLTGLQNRRGLQKVVSDYLPGKEGTPVAIGTLMADIDNFKQYNDRYGHLKGDSALVRIGEIFKTLAHQYNFLVFRFGGEEFAALRFHTTREEMETIAEEIQKALQAAQISFDFDNGKILTASIGLDCSVAASCVEDVYRSINLADKALYTAKKNGKNQIVFYTKPESAE